LRIQGEPELYVSKKNKTKQKLTCPQQILSASLGRDVFSPIQAMGQEDDSQCPLAFVYRPAFLLVWSTLFLGMAPPLGLLLPPTRMWTK
jgi:hypothetical protein